MISHESIEAGPIPFGYTHQEWWKQHCKYSKFNRQGVDILCASFISPTSDPKGNVFLVTAWNETFLRYSDLIHNLVAMNNFNVHTYDHQGQGFSGRWTIEQDIAWVHSFDDYSDDFSFFVTSISRSSSSSSSSSLPVYVIAKGLGGLIVSLAMSRNPTLVNKAILVAPLFRSKFRINIFGYSLHIPEPIAYYSVLLLSLGGFGAFPSLWCSGFEQQWPILDISSDDNQRKAYETLLQHYPTIASTWFTNDWIRLCIVAQKKFYRRFKFIRTNILILCGEWDIWAHNRAVAEFAKVCSVCKVIMAPCLHDILFETTSVREAAHSTIDAYLNQISEDVNNARVIRPFLTVDPTFADYSITEKIIRGSCLVVASLGALLGVSLMIAGSPSSR